MSRKPPAAGSARDSTTHEIAAKIAHDVNNPLTVVIANVELLAETIARMGIESGSHLDTPEARAWLRSHLTETEVCLDDMRAAAERIRVVVYDLGQHERPAGTPEAGRADVLVRGRVLVVDDQRDVAKVVGRMLRGLDVVVTVSARDSLTRIADGERFDAILCDLMMPEMTGFELYAEIMRLAPDQAERMIFMTGGPTTEEASDFLAKTTLSVVTKPIDQNGLRLLIEKLLHPPAR